jgi:proteasome assembly chaperone (PAC2) family protein
LFYDFDVKYVILGRGILGGEFREIEPKIITPLCNLVKVELASLNEKIKVKETVSLHNASMIIGLSGWGNAGDVSTFTIKYLTDKLGAKKLGEISPEKFHNYLIQRPIVSIEEGVIQSYVTPQNELFYWVDKKGRADLVLLLGSEPHINWPGYTETILRLVKEMGIKRIYTIGGYLSDISQEGETPISASTNNESLIDELHNIGVVFTNYHGPTSIYSEMLWKGRESNIDVVSLWSMVPMYIEGVYPDAAYSVIRKLMKLIGVKLNLEDLKEKANVAKSKFEKEGGNQVLQGDVVENLRRRQTYIS